MASPVNRRDFIAASASIAAAGLAGVTVVQAEGAQAMPDSLLELLNHSMSAKRGVTVAYPGGSVAMVVTEITDHYAVGRSQQYDKIVVKLADVSAAYM